MKKLFLTLVMSTAVLVGCDFFVDPVAYNDKIVDIDDRALDVYEAYITQADNTDLVEADLTTLETKRVDSVAQIKTIKAEMEAMEGLKGDTTLRDVFIKDLDELLKTLENEEKQLIEVWKRMAATDGEATQEDLDLEETLFKTIEDRSDAIYTEVSNAQEAFATEHGYDLEPPTVQ